MNTKALALSLTIFLVTGASGAFAQNVRVRGTVEKLDGDAVKVKTADGRSVDLKLAPNYSVSAVVKATLADIKPGTYIGAGARPQPDGSLKAVQVAIFPEAQRGTGEGHRDWDVMPEATMTNATVGETVSNVNGPTLTLNYKGGEKKLIIPPDANIIATVPTDKADLKVGAEMVTTAAKGADGAMTASRITVGKNGVAPPL